MSALLEVIVTSVEEAVEAQAGGADRLELLAAPEHAGLTPSCSTVENVVRSVSIPVRVMLRDEPSMSVGSSAEFAELLALPHASPSCRSTVLLRDSSKKAQWMKKRCCRFPVPRQECRLPFTEPLMYSPIRFERLLA